MISIQDARAIVLARARPICDGESVPIQAAVGRSLAQAITADGDLPPFDRVTMDGYAVRAADLREGGVSLPLDGETAAGDPSDNELMPGKARAIMTGAALPPGADAVVQVEWTEERDGSVHIRQPVRPGQNVAPRGQDLARGTQVAGPGDRVTALSLSLLIAAGVGEVSVRRRPRVCLLTSGNELVAPGQPVRRGQIRESNGPALAGLLALTGALVEDRGSVPDDEAALTTAVGNALDADVVVLTGGASVGRYDFSARVIESFAGVERHFNKLAVKPGKPTLFYTRGSTLVFCLPGNPVAALMTGRVLVAPALAALAGQWPEAWPSLRLPLASPLRRNAARDLLVPVAVRQGKLEFAGWHGSGDLVCMASADAFAHLEQGEGEAPAGTLASVFPLPVGTHW